jgi:type II secretory pathway pseudopilin PulG
MRSHRQSEHRAESGFVLIAVLFLVALILIALAVAAPKMAKSIQRDKELELIHRGDQYKRAIKLYYKKFGAYPSTMDQLMNTNQVRFLRKRYTDPMTGKDDWKLIYFGQAKVPPMGLFGQPLANAGGTNAVGPGMGTPIGGASTTGGNTTAPASGSTDGSASSSFGSSSGSSFGSSSGSSFGSSSGSSFGSSSGNSFGQSSGSSFGSSSGSSFGQSSGGSYGSSTGTTNTGGSPGGTATGSGATGAFGSSGSTGSTLGGGPIVGVAIPDTKASMKEYKKQKHYNEWEFVYNPIEDQLQGMGALGAGGQQNLNGSNTSGFGAGTSSGFGSSTGGSSFGTSSGFGSSSGTGSTMNGGPIGSPSSGPGMTQPQPQQ